MTNEKPKYRLEKYNTESTQSEIVSSASLRKKPEDLQDKTFFGCSCNKECDCNVECDCVDHCSCDRECKYCRCVDYCSCNRNCDCDDNDSCGCDGNACGCEQWGS